MKLAILLFVPFLFTVLTGCSSKTTDITSADTRTPHRGGTLRYATIGEPPTLDMMATINTVSREVTSNMYEGLFTFDSHFVPQPSLAQSYKIEDHGLRWVIALRQGVLFHNGQEMMSDDVLASLNRWVRMTPGGNTLFKNMESLEAPDRFSIVIRLKKPMPIVANLLAVPGDQSAIFPKSVIDAAGKGKLEEYIGTGPYKFLSWKPNQYIELVRFDRYQPRSETPDGMAGNRDAYADDIRFIPVPEVQQRVQGVQTGLYDLAANISPDLYGSVQDLPSVEPMIVKPFAFPVLAFNKKVGIFRDLKMRQSVQAAADFQSMMQAAFGSSIFYRLDPSILPRETKWWSDAGKGLYNQNNPAKAKQLLQDAGYRGQTVRILTTKQYDWTYRMAVVLKSQLEAIGMHAALDVVDNATAAQRRDDPSAYEIYVTYIFPLRDPAAFPQWDATSFGWWVNSQKDSLLQQLASEPDDSRRLALQAQFQELWYADVPMLRVGDIFDLRIASKKVHGSGMSSPLLYLFNCWLSK